MKSKEADQKNNDAEAGWVRDMLMTHRVRGGKVSCESGDAWVFTERPRPTAPHGLAFLLQVADDTLFEIFDRAGNSLGYSTIADFTRGSSPGGDDAG